MRNLEIYNLIFFKYTFFAKFPTYSDYCSELISCLRFEKIKLFFAKQKEIVLQIHPINLLLIFSFVKFISVRYHCNDIDSPVMHHWKVWLSELRLSRKFNLVAKSTVSLCESGFDSWISNKSLHKSFLSYHTHHCLQSTDLVLLSLYY